MALTVIIKDIPAFEWHVGELSLFGYARDVCEIYADGDELWKIKSEIQGIPMSNQRGVFWYGDHAKFILANLSY